MKNMILHGGRAYLFFFNQTTRDEGRDDQGRTAVEAEHSGACSPAPPQFLWSLSKEASQEVLGVIAGATWLEGIWRYARAWLVGRICGGILAVLIDAQAP